MGVLEGLTVGVLVGTFVGVNVGVFVGVSVGVFVAVLVGFFVGTVDGVIGGLFVAARAGRSARSACASEDANIATPKARSKATPTNRI